MSLMAPKKFSAATGSALDTPLPFTLREAVQKHNLKIRAWDYSLPEFFDLFYMATEPEQRAYMLAEEPSLPLIWGTDQPAMGWHIYLGGVTEWLSKQAGITPPEWINKSDRFSINPIYPYDQQKPYTDEEKKSFHDMALPEFARRNYFANNKLHERGNRWIVGFDPEDTEQRRQLHQNAEDIDSRAIRLIQPLLEKDHGIVQAEADLRRLMLSECLKQPGTKLEDVLAHYNAKAVDLDLDLSPAPPSPFWLPATTKHKL